MVSLDNSIAESQCHTWNTSDSEERVTAGQAPSGPRELHSQCPYSISPCLASRLGGTCTHQLNPRSLHEENVATGRR